jgi:lipopolysaccharide transport system ATP-binding protein
MRSWLVHPHADNVCVDLEISGGFSDSPYWITRREGVVAPVFPWEQRKR